MVNEYSPNPAAIKDTIEETNNTNTYVLEFFDKKLQKDFSWRPGQFMMLSLFGIGESAISNFVSNLKAAGKTNLEARE